MREGSVFLRIMLPEAWPGIMAGITLSFTRSLGEFGATLMIAGNIPGKTQTIPMAIYFATSSGDMRTAWIWVGLMMLLSFLSLGFSSYLAARREQ
jgi:molybdate transport system permease protein